MIQCNHKVKKNKLISLFRITRPITTVLGPEFITSMDTIEIDISFSCNLKCYNCDRSCTQAPDDRMMDFSQISKFINESIFMEKKWSRIRILGGEPLLHPAIFHIIDILLDYKQDHSPNTMLELTTNGYGSFVNDRLKSIPRSIYVNNTKKTGRYQKKFEAFNLAPCDNILSLLSDYSNACWITNECGMGLNRYGYYQCGAAGSIDRVFGFDLGLKKIPDDSNQFNVQKKALCKLCGHFTARTYMPYDERVPVDGEPKSNSWLKAYKKYLNNPPVLSLY